MANGDRTHRTKLHAQRRARQRYGAEEPSNLTLAIARLIRRELRKHTGPRAGRTDNKNPRDNTNCWPLTSRDGHRSMWKVTVGDQQYRVIWDRAARLVVTFLPLDGGPADKQASPPRNEKPCAKTSHRPAQSTVSARPAATAFTRRLPAK